MSATCMACGKPIVLVNVDKMRGVIGLTQGWVHRSRWANRSHQAVPGDAVVREPHDTEGDA